MRVHVETLFTRDAADRLVQVNALRAWATMVRELARTPLYSTSWDNAASRALARSLGLVQSGATLHLT